MRALSQYQRALLVIDGTVTKFIEAYTMEPLQIDQLRHESVELESASDSLQLDRGAHVAHRSVVISGKYSRKPYVYAVSDVVIEKASGRDVREVAASGRGDRENHQRHVP